MNVRTAKVAGAFYPGTATEINGLVDRILDSEKGNIDYTLSELGIIGCVVPHAGYIFSAYEAVHFFEILKNSGREYDTFIIINPNHTGYGEYIEVDSSDSWKTPLGEVPLDTEFARALGLPCSSEAQQQEHSAEVMLPLLQIFLPYRFRVLPVCMRRQNPMTARELAEKIREANAALNRRLMIIASSDFSHFETPANGRRKDELVLEQIENRNPGKLYDTVIRNRISVCGYGPIMTLMEYSGMVCEDPRSRILARGDSGKTRPSDSVVDYISILFYNPDPGRQ